jgi:hypothetical protein
MPSTHALQATLETLTALAACWEEEQVTQAITSGTASAYLEGEAGLKQLLLSQADAAMDRIRRIKAVEEQASAAEAGYQFGLNLASTLDLPEVFDATLTSALDLLSGSVSASIFTLEEGTLVFGAAYWTGGQRSPAQASQQPDSLVYRTARQGTVLVEALAHTAGKRLGQPLKRGEDLVGVLALSTTHPGEIPKQQLRDLQALAEQAALPSRGPDDTNRSARWRLRIF